MSSRTVLKVPFVLVACALSLIAQAQDVAAQLRQLPHVKDVRAMGQDPAKSTRFDVSFEQPVDHKDPSGPKFVQHVYVAHSDFGKPVILGTEGYSANGASGGELTRYLDKPNVVTVEHRYFGKSIPDPCVWKHLTVKNSADDLHTVVESLKGLYKGKWVSTGASKGGQTALYFKCFYPDDVDAVVAYVAPINLAQEDPRINIFMETVGDAETRRKVKEFQIALLKREDEVLPLLNAKESDYSMGVAKAYEYGVLEYPYAFWQYGSNKSTLPAPDAPAKELADAYRKVNAMFYYSDRGIKMFEAFQYQAFTEVGYYNYDITDFRPYLKANPDPTNRDLCPKGTKDTIVYDPRTLQFVYHELQYNAKNIVFIYGETDAWSATQMHLIGRTNAVKVVVKGAWHNAEIGLASPEQREQVLTALEGWLGTKLVRR